MCRKNRYCLRKVDFKTIVQRKWLNDEIINYYLNLLENDRTKSLDVFFYSTLKKSKAIAVDRLIKAEVMNFDMIFVPINVSNHWILCTIDTTSKTIQWYDSYLSLTSLTTKHKKMDLIRDAVNEAVSPGEIQWKTSVIQKRYSECT
ncbi:sentrin-specific protease 1-like [Mytilus galloprovincialis]|uniref:sentrin-specific protease 1-like n=1 Tax=Mytilus galloprovincialis TaxID=29158 RepID=UPI003F7CD1B6